MELFDELTFTNNTKSLKPTDDFLIAAWSNLCERHSKKLSADAIRLLCSLSYDFSTSVDGFNSCVTGQLEDPFSLASDAAALFPEDYPNWEAQDYSLCERTDCGGLILSWDGFVLASKLKKEVSRVYNLELGRIKSNSYIHPMHF